MVRRHPWLVVWMCVLALVCVVVAGGAAYWYHANQLPVYLPPNVMMPVPNAYDDYVAAAQMCQAVGGSALWTPVPGRAAGRLAPGAVGGWASLPGQRVTRNGRRLMGYDPDAPLDQVRAAVARNRPALARLRQGFGKSYRNPPVMSFIQPFPELAGYRELARVLVTEGRLAEREGRLRDAARSYLDCLRLGADVPRGGVLIHGLVGLAIQNIGLVPLQDLAGRVDASTALAVSREMTRLETRFPSAVDVLQGERDAGTAGLLDIFHGGMSLRQLRGVAPGGSSVPPSATEIFWGLQFALTPRARVVENYRGYMDALIADARKPYYASTAPPPLPSDPMNRILLPVFSRTKLQWATRDTHWRITQLRLAARAYQLQHGTPPPAPKALVPTYFSAVPQDPFAGKPLVYRRNGQRVIAYSRGPDGDDDGGQDVGNRLQEGSNGDIVHLKRR